MLGLISFVVSFQIAPLYLLYGQLVHIDNSKLALVRIVCFSVQFISRIRISLRVSSSGSS